jgi:hypothetical protein
LLIEIRPPSECIDRNDPLRKHNIIDRGLRHQAQNAASVLLIVECPAMAEALDGCENLLRSEHWHFKLSPE